MCVVAARRELSKDVSPLPVASASPTRVSALVTSAAHRGTPCHAAPTPWIADTEAASTGAPMNSAIFIARFADGSGVPQERTMTGAIASGMEKDRLEVVMQRALR